MNIKTKTGLFGLTVLWTVLSAGSLVFASQQEFAEISPAGLRVEESGQTLLAQASSIYGGGGSITQVDAEVESDGSEVVTIRSIVPIQYTAFKLMNPLRLVLDFPKMNKGDLEDRIDVRQGLVDSIRSIYFSESDVLRVEIALNKAVVYDIQKPTSNRLVISLQEATSQMAEVSGSSTTETTKEATQEKTEQESTASLDPCAPMFAGGTEKISLDFQGADIRNIFRIFSEISEFNLILGTDVQGTVNLRLLDVPWNEAFDLVLTNNGLGKFCQGDNIVQVATLATLNRRANVQVAADQAQADAEEQARLSADLVTEVRRINNATITELATSLDAVRTERGRVTVDARTNTIIMSDIQELVEKMLDLVKLLDIETPQVTIEARIVEVQKTFAQELGIQWGLTGTLDRNLTSGLNRDLIITDGAGAQGITTPGGTAASNFMVNLGLTAATSGFGILLGNVLAGLDLDIRLNALESQNLLRIISAPKVTTLDNKEAKITQGSKVPFVTTSTEGNTTEFYDADLSLTVTPHITPEDKVYMVIDATNNSVGSTVTTGGVASVLLTTEEAHAEVLVDSGETTVLGGVYKRTLTDTESSVPLFSKIPFLGYLFKNQVGSDVVTELLVFVTPTVVQNQ